MTPSPSLPPWLHQWAAKTLSAKPPDETEWALREHPHALQALGRILADSQIATQLAREFQQLAKTDLQSSEPRLTYLLTYAALAAAHVSQTQEVSATEMAKKLEASAKQCRKLTKDLRKLDGFPERPNFTLSARKNFSHKFIQSAWIDGPPSATPLMSTLEYLEYLADRLDTEALSWRTARTAGRRRLSGNHARRNRLIDGVVEIAIESLQYVPYALISSMVSVLTGDATDEATVRQRSKRFVRQLPPRKR